MACDSGKSTELVGSTAVYSHAFHAANTNELNTDVVAAVLLVRAVNEFPGHGFQIVIASNRGGNFPIGHGAVQTIGTQQQHVAREQLDFVDFYPDEQPATQGPAENVSRGRRIRFLSGKQA